MMRYDPTVHSPIFGPIEKPCRVGWYAGSCIDEMESANIGEDPYDQYWWFWDGEKWMVSDTSLHTATYQSRYWFGLRADPQTEQRPDLPGRQG